MCLTILFIAVAFRCCLSDVLIHFGDVVIEKHSEAMNWRNASRVCKENKGHLVRDGPEFHSQLPAGTFWLDKMNIAATGWTWSDGSGVEFGAQRERCIVVKDGSWHIEDCTSKHKFLCQHPWSWEDKGFDTKTAKGRALKFFPTTTTWDDAQKKCRNLIKAKPGYLITVESEDVKKWVMDKKVKTWIGLNDKDKEGKLNEGKYVWDSGKTYRAYKNVIGSDLTDAGTEDCVVANWPKSNGNKLTWNDIPCDRTDYARAYACEIWL